MRFPAGLCSAPPCLHGLFSHSYHTSLDKQIELSKKNDAILNESLLYLDVKPFSNAKHLLNLMCFLLAKYKKPAEEDFNEFLRVIVRQNNPNSYYYAKPEYENFGTTFSLEGKRAWTNFFVLERFLKLKDDDQVMVTVGDFCKRASEYLSIQLQPDPDILGIVISEVRKRDAKSIRHNFHFLDFADEKKYTHLFALYDQLLQIIFPSSVDANSNTEQKRLNAIFLLVFLVGSNAPMYYTEKNERQTGSGGAFVTDALLQLLLIKAGFPPARKNYLNLIEVALLFQYATNNREAYEAPLNAYYESMREGKTNIFFHPHSTNEHLSLQEILKKSKLLECPINNLNCKILLPIYIAQVVMLSDKVQTSEFQNMFFNYVDFDDTIFTILNSKKILSVLTVEEKCFIRACFFGKGGLLYRSNTMKEIIKIFRIFSREQFEEREAALLFLIEKIASYDDFCKALECNEMFFTKGERLIIVMSVLPSIKLYADTEEKVNYLFSDEFSEKSGLTLHARGLLHEALTPEYAALSLASIFAPFPTKRQVYCALPAEEVGISFDELLDDDNRVSATPFVARNYV